MWDEVGWSHPIKTGGRDEVGRSHPIKTGGWDEVGRSHPKEIEDLAAGGTRWDDPTPKKTGGLKQQVGRSGTVPPHEKWWFSAAGGTRWDSPTP